VTAATSLHTRITATIRKKQLFKPGDTLIIGLSGGADSTALLDLLATLPAFPVRLVAAHLNHCLRGGDSDDDEQFCRELAAHYNIHFESRRVDIKTVANRESLNLEDAGRRARVIFLMNSSRDGRQQPLSWHTTPTTRPRQFLCGCCAVRA